LKLFAFVYVGQQGGVSWRETFHREPRARPERGIGSRSSISDRLVGGRLSAIRIFRDNFRTAGDTPRIVAAAAVIPRREDMI
jgi:hypothetical protein